jgi:hypothetical protein
MASHRHRTFLRLIISASLGQCLFAFGTITTFVVEPVAAQANGGNCALPNHPDASCTGVPAGIALTVVKGDLVVSAANAVVDSKDIRGCVRVTAPGVTIRNSKITCRRAPYAVDTFEVAGAWLTIQDSVISCAGRTGTTAIGEENVTVLRSDISGCENGFDTNKNMLIPGQAPLPPLTWLDRRR